eukprot:scaffold35989_cov84-Isochrysis_galbana.AAC.4
MVKHRMRRRGGRPGRTRRLRNQGGGDAFLSEEGRRASAEIKWTTRTRGGLVKSMKGPGGGVEGRVRQCCNAVWLNS